MRQAVENELDRDFGATVWANTVCGRRYNDDEPCSSQSSSTAFYTQTQLRQRDFCTEKVPVLM